MPRTVMSVFRLGGWMNYSENLICLSISTIQTYIPQKSVYLLPVDNSLYFCKAECTFTSMHTDTLFTDTKSSFQVFQACRHKQTTRIEIHKLSFINKTSRKTQGEIEIWTDTEVIAAAAAAAAGSSLLSAERPTPGPKKKNNQWPCWLTAEHCLQSLTKSMQSVRALPCIFFLKNKPDHFGTNLSSLPPAARQVMWNEWDHLIIVGTLSQFDKRCSRGDRRGGEETGVDGLSYHDHVQRYTCLHQ